MLTQAHTAPQPIIGGIPTGVPPQLLATPRHEQGLQWLHARRAYAFTVGEELALQRAISADAFLFLYKELVRLCKERTYCWAGLQWLAKRLTTSLGTLKRWIEELVTAGLIRRTSRPGGQTALTTIPALEVFDVTDDEQANKQQPAFDESRPSIATPNVSKNTASGHSDSPQTPSDSPVFFVPKQRISNESSDGVNVSRHTVKKQNFNVVGCEQRQATTTNTNTSSPTTHLLEHAGVLDITILNELRDEPVTEIDALIRYVRSQPNAWNPPGLLVALAREKFGRRLINRQAQHPYSDHRAHQSKKRQSGSGSISSLPADAAASLHKHVDVNNPDDHAGLWQRVLERLQEDVPEQEFSIWLQETAVVDVTDDVVIVGTPNIFARDTLEARYQTVIVAAIRHELGTHMRVQYVIP